MYMYGLHVRTVFYPGVCIGVVCPQGGRVCPLSGLGGGYCHLMERRRSSCIAHLFEVDSEVMDGHGNTDSLE